MTSRAVTAHLLPPASVPGLVHFSGVVAEVTWAQASHGVVQTARLASCCPTLVHWLDLYSAMALESAQCVYVPDPRCNNVNTRVILAFAPMASRNLTFRDLVTMPNHSLDRHDGSRYETSLSGLSYSPVVSSTNPTLKPDPQLVAPLHLYYQVQACHFGDDALTDTTPVGQIVLTGRLRNLTELNTGSGST